MSLFIWSASDSERVSPVNRAQAGDRRYSVPRMADPIRQFVDSFARVGAMDLQSSGFIDSFYRNFLDSSPLVADKFQNTDMTRQREMLRISLDHMVYFAIDKEETGEIARVAKAHSSTQADIPAPLYDLWLDSLLRTVSEFDPEYNDHIDSAWREALEPAIDYMKRHYEDDASES